MKQLINYYILLIFFVCIWRSYGMKVSFYGSSYITMPLQEAKISTNIRFKFKTQQENGFIFLAAGRTDYCLLKLQSSRINFSYRVDHAFIEIWSPRKLILNDNIWHDIAIHRYDSNVTMQVDNHFITKVLNENASELNVHFGIFLGGFGDFSESYLNAVSSYRGCLSDVFYNNINVLKRAKEGTGHSASYGVSWTCSTEFDAKMTDSISFIDDNSFVMVQRTPTILDESWSFDIRTIESIGSIFYNVGKDFVSIEISDRRIRVILTKGRKYVIELISDNNISDGNWHSISYKKTSQIIEIDVDGITKSATFPNDTTTLMELSNEYYFGSQTEDTKRKITAWDLNTEEISFKGCIRNILYNNNEIIGLPIMEITNGIQVDCVWRYPCVEKLPCILTSTCRQHGIDDFICDCDQAFCIKADYTETYKIFDPISENELVQISSVYLPEGGTVFLSSQFMKILIDITEFDIPDSSIIFHVAQPPKYGQLFVYSSKDVSSNNSICKTFSLKELNTDKVKYIHNGMENFSDHMTIDLQFTSIGNLASSSSGNNNNNNNNNMKYLQGKHRFLLHFNITPVNDGPILKIPEDRVLRVIQGISKQIKNNFLNVIDPDSQQNSLIYSILTPMDVLGTHGRFEMNGTKITKFSQHDINQGYITYIFDMLNVFEDTFFDIELQVSDGIETSRPATLSISVHPLELRIINNTGLILIHKSFALITSINLYTVTNSDEDNIDVRYDIVKLPKYGYIQRYRSVDSSWISVESFTNSQITLGHIRYYHSSIDLPTQDEFKFTASYGKVVSQTYDFRISFTKLRIEAIKQENIYMNGTREITVTDDYLFHQTIPQSTFARNIIYTILKTTKYGSIHLDGHPKAAKEMDSFTQLDIEKNLIRYKTYRTSYSPFIDELEFTVSVLECDDVHGTLKIIFKPDERLESRLIRHRKETLRVKEGDRIQLNRGAFEIYFDSFKNLTFQISIAPKYGKLCRYDLIQREYKTVTEFSISKLEEIHYCHDDSESEFDTFELLALSDDLIDFQYVCSINVVIQLLNDNAPYRSIERVLHVVRNSTRTLTSEILSYHDNDIDTNLSSIKYMHLSCNNGKFYKNDKLIDHFSQFDINNNLIVFHHYNFDLGTASFIVTDGFFEVPGILEIEASEPFISIPHSNASIVQENHFVVLRKDHLPLETNLNTRSNEIHYKIIKSPLYGIVYLEDNTSALSGTDNANYYRNNYTTNSIVNFNREDILMERVLYYNTETASMDQIRYRVSIGNITAEGEMLIRIYPAAYWEPLQIRRNETLYVEESTSVLITKDVLEVVHPSISPGDITYLVTNSPFHGYLEMQSMNSDDEFNCKVFDQSAINTEKLSYIHAGVNQSSDYFIFDVTNGITWLKNLILKIIIIPENLYIKADPIIVVEGKNVIIHSDNIQPISEYYKSKILEYKIIQQPTYGFITTGKSKINRFTQKQLDSGFVQYMHDGSENPTDSLKLIAIARTKESIPFDLKMVVSPVNDEVPAIVTNTGLQIWNGGKYIIKNTDIMAQDYDTGPDMLTYHIGHVYGGYLANIRDYRIKIDQFTQSDINNEEVIFVHDPNSRTNEFSFILSDGLFNTTEQIVFITVKQVNLFKVNNEFLHVFPMTRKQILADHLLYTSSDETQRVQYTITVPSQLGRILQEDNGEVFEITEFDQDDINNGRIYYEHITAMLELKTNDSFMFDVKVDPVVRLIDQHFNIEISVSSGGLLRFMSYTKLNVEEGGTVPINLDFSKILDYLKSRAGIIAPELYIETHKPLHGYIELLSERIDTNGKLLRSDFEAGNVHYTHDHSDTLDDEVIISVYLSQGNIFLCNLSIPVTIDPINDQPFNLVTTLPHISVVEGENITITRNYLRTDDADSTPNEIIYEIISGPTIGILLKLNDNNIPLDILEFGNRFTQADIDSNRIIYEHNGQPQSTTFHFKVWDGMFKPIYEIFNITIVPISIKPHYLEQNDIKIQQGEQLALLNENNILIDTNVQRSRLMYNITNSPLSGFILLDRQPTLRFSNKHLKDGKVSYMQTDLNKSNDTFQVIVYVNNTSYGSSVDVKIVVEPFIKIEPVTLRAGEKVRLTSSFTLDNPTLLKFNKYNPKFSIIRPPKKGFIKKIIRSTTNMMGNGNGNDLGTTLSNKIVNFFTYKELKSGVIYFETDDSTKSLPKTVLDSFDYMLTMKIVQPAQATVPIEISGETDDLDTIHVAQSTEYTIIYLALFCAFLAILIIIIVVLVFIGCRRNRIKKETTETDYPPTLPRLPEFTTLNSAGNRFYSTSDAGESATAPSTPLPGISNIPHCKVIPIGNLDVDLMDFDPDEDTTDDQVSKDQYQTHNIAGENDEWSSSYDMGNDLECSGLSASQQPHQSTNPLLRRNQYWV